MAQESKSNQEVNALPRNEAPSFDIAIAIDFGTDGLGVAYALPNATRIHVHDKWKSKNYDTIVKPKTIILFNNFTIFFNLSRSIII